MYKGPVIWRKQGGFCIIQTHVKKENILSNIRFTPIPVHGEKLLYTPNIKDLDREYK
jgi:hypothetical protein